MQNNIFSVRLSDEKVDFLEKFKNTSEVIRKALDMYIAVEAKKQRETMRIGNQHVRIQNDYIAIEIDQLNGSVTIISLDQEYNSDEYFVISKEQAKLLAELFINEKERFLK